MLSQYLATKQLVSESIARLRNLADRMGSPNAVSALFETERRLSEDSFYLAVLGHFKRGKSTLINALLGTPLLPTGIIPLTSIITKIRYGERREATVFFKDGTSRVVNTEGLEEYITEKGNPSNHKNVSEVEVTIPSTYVKDGVIFIDTPGVGSTYMTNTSVTYNFMSKVDAAIFVLAVDPPISQGEIEFLRDVREQVHKVFFAQNKIDYVSEDEWREAVNFAESVPRKVLDTDAVVVYPLSSKLALEARIEGSKEKLELSRLPEFETELRDFLTRGKGQVIIDSATKNALKIASDLATALELERRALQIPIEELESKMVWLKGETEVITRKMNEIEYLINGSVKEIMNRYDSELEVFKKKMEPLLITKLEEFLKEVDSSMGSRALADRVEEFTRHAIVENYKPFMAEQDTKITWAFENIVCRFEDEVDRLIDEVKQQTSRVFGIQIHSHASGRSLTRESRFYFHIDTVFGSDTMFLGELPFLLPKPLFQKALRKRARESIIMELDKNGGRIRYDFLYRLTESARRLKGDIASRMSTTLETINNAIKLGYQVRSQAVGSLEANLIRLNQFESELQAIRRTLTPLEIPSQAW